MDDSARDFLQAGWTAWFQDLELDRKLEQIIAQAQLVQDLYSQRRKEEWQQWSEDAFKNGGRDAHRFTRLRALQQVLQASDHSTPAQLADHELEKWQQIWSLHGAGELPRPADADVWEHLPELAGAQIRATIRSFARRTGRGQMRILPRHFWFVRDEGLQAMAE
eukprot:7353669-Pyramimonas_sp.AAC.1